MSDTPQYHAKPMATEGTTPSDWVIHCAGSGWVAWNAKRSQKMELTRHGGFSEAVNRFNERIGDYYASRSQPTAPTEASLLHGACELKDCSRSGVRIRVTEAMDDGCWSVLICTDCAEALGLRPGGELPNGRPCPAQLAQNPACPAA